MPELPEIEILRRDLEKEIVGRRIKEVDVRPGSNAMKIIRRHGRRKELQDLLGGAKVDSVDRIGKALVFRFDNGKALIADLADAGGLYKTSASDTMVTNTHIVFSFTIGGQLRLVDPLKTSEIYVTEADAIADELKSDAIDPLEQQLTWNHFSALLDQKAQPMKEVLTDQGFIAGLGDVYTDEILWTAGIRPDRPSDKLTSQDVRRIYRGLIEVLQEAVKLRGTTVGISDFKDLHGIPGQYQLELKVYEREGESCRRCRNAIVKEEFAGRVTYLCPQCQS